MQQPLFFLKKYSSLRPQTRLFKGCMFAMCAGLLFGYPHASQAEQTNLVNIPTNTQSGDKNAPQYYSNTESYPYFNGQEGANLGLVIPNTPETITSIDVLAMPEDTDIWQRIKDGYAIPDAKSTLVQKHERAFTSTPKLINTIVDRSQKYLFHIVEEVQNRGMPTEIALLPMIESAYNPKAYSSSKAAGIWQFIPSTGKNFGLKQNWWVDNRRNVTFATDAALSYLQKLHVMFGAWDLALAAYNAGEGTVRRAIEKNKRLGKPTNYANLDLPAETKNYVPKLQAIKNIMTHPGNYGITIKPIENKAYFTTVTAPSQIDSKLVAELAEITYEEFIALNPSYNRPVIAAAGDTQELLLPITSVEKFHQNLANYDKPLVNWKTYTAKPGELLSTVANQNQIELDKLRKVNQLPAIKRFNKPTILLVPNHNTLEKLAVANPQKTMVDAQVTTDNNVDSLNAEALPTVSEVTTEESLSDFSEVQNAGNIDMSHLEKMQNMQAIETENTATKTKASSQPAITHVVKSGDTLDKIAKKYQISPKSIASSNHLKKNQVKIGQKLLIKPATSTDQTIVKNKARNQNSASTIKTKDKKTKSKVDSKKASKKTDTKKATSSKKKTKPSTEKSNKK